MGDSARRPASARLSGETISGRERLTNRLLACGVVGPLLFIVVFLIEGATRPGYSAWRNFVSSLSLGPGGWVQVANFLVWGALALAFAVGVRRALAHGPGSVAGPITFGVYALALIVAGVFRTDPGQGYPPGQSTLTTPHGAVHALSGLVVFVSLTVAAAVFTRRFAKLEGWRGWALYSGLTSIAVLGFFIASVAPDHLPIGLMQRIAIITGWLWIALLAARLLRERGAAPMKL